MSKIIGIIGGNGVAATNKLCEMIETSITYRGGVKCRDVNHPEIIIWQATKAPSRSMYIEGRGDSFIDDYIDIAKKLKYCGASKICICCNTAHYAIEEIENKAGIEIINLIENVALRVKSITDIKSVGLVVSDGCLKGRVYEKYFSRICPDVKIIYPDVEYQKLSTKGICNIKNFHRFDDINSTENPFNIFKKVKNHLLEKGADKVIMGCTDIRVGYFEKENIDSLEVLKDTILKEFS